MHIETDNDVVEITTWAEFKALVDGRLQAAGRTDDIRIAFIDVGVNQPDPIHISIFNYLGIVN